MKRIGVIQVLLLAFCTIALISCGDGKSKSGAQQQVQCLIDQLLENGLCVAKPPPPPPPPPPVIDDPDDPNPPKPPMCGGVEFDPDADQICVTKCNGKKLIYGDGKPNSHSRTFDNCKFASGGDEPMAKSRHTANQAAIAAATNCAGCHN